MELKNQELDNKIANFHKAKCEEARDTLAAHIIDLAISICTNTSNLHFSDSSLLILQYSYDQTHLQIHFEGNQICFSLKHDITFQPGEVKTLQLNFITNSQILPELASDLDEHLALAPTVEFIPQLSIGEIGIANCSKNIFELHSAVHILSLTFVTDRLKGS